MWFMFPEGATNISVEQQQFAIEAKDPQGRGYFRAPDHFAPKILAIPGFAVASDVPEGAPDDLPVGAADRNDPLREMTALCEAQKLELQHLREDYTAQSAAMKALSLDMATVRGRLEEAEERIVELEETLVDAGKYVPVAAKVSEKVK